MWPLLLEVDDRSPEILDRIDQGCKLQGVDCLGDPRLAKRVDRPKLRLVRRRMMGPVLGNEMTLIPSVFSSFDQIRIVNLPARVDRRAAMEIELSKVGLLGDSRVQFFDALSFSEPGPFLRTGSHGAFKSHLALLREAAAADQSMLILQDDCDFILPDIIDYTMPDDWDVFYGGYLASNPDDLHNSEIIGAHFMGFSPRAAKAAAAYLSDYLNEDFPPDPLAAAEPSFDPAIRPPIDGALVWFRRAHPELRTVFAMLGVQRSSRTDIGDQQWFDKIPVLRHLAEAARRCLPRHSPG